MAGSFRVDGLISGLDTSDIISKYMQIERQPINLLESKKATLNAKSNAWREMNTRLYKLRDSARDLQSIFTFRGKTVKNSNTDLLSVTAEDNALNSSYKIEVGKLAQAQSLASSNISVSGTDEALGLSGTLKITVNGVEKEIAVGADDPLESLVQKINNTAEIGVTASAIQVGAGEYKLTLTSKETGLANQINIEGDLAGALAFTETQAAQDAELKINGLTVTRSSNIIKDVIQGVTLELKKAGESTEITVETDQQKIVDAVKAFVTAYNSVMDYVNQNASYSYNEQTKKGSAGPLFGDSGLMSIQTQLKSYFSQAVSGVAEEVNQLALIGIESVSGIEGVKSGKIEFDEEKFLAKLDAHFDDIAKLFGAKSDESVNGVFAQMYDYLLNATGADGFVTGKTNSLTAQIRDIDGRIADFEERLEQKEKYYYTKFTAMETALAKIQNQANWLTAQLGALYTR